MRTLTNSEKRTILISAAVIVLYFVLFGIPKSWRSAGGTLGDYQKLQKDADDLKCQIDFYTNLVFRAQNLMEGFQMDPAKLYRTSVVAQASAAIQKAAA